MEDLIFSNLITALCSGSLSWLATVKWQRKDAEAGALAHVQDIYQEIITDLNEDRRKLAEDRKALVAENAELRREFFGLKSRFDEMQAKVEATERFVRTISPWACSLARTCPNFTIIKEQKS